MPKDNSQRRTCDSKALSPDLLGHQDNKPLLIPLKYIIWKMLYVTMEWLVFRLTGTNGEFFDVLWHEGGPHRAENRPDLVTADDGARESFVIPSLGKQL